MDNDQKETHVVSVMTDKQKETCAVVRDEKDHRPLPAPNSKANTDDEGENSPKHVATQMKALQTDRAKFRAVTKIETVKTRHVIFGIFPCVKTTSLRPDANFGRTFFRHVVAEEKPNKKNQRKVVRKDQLH